MKLRTLGNLDKASIGEAFGEVSTLALLLLLFSFRSHRKGYFKPLLPSLNEEVFSVKIDARIICVLLFWNYVTHLTIDMTIYLTHLTKS
jgi:hypothetical protein